MALSSGRRAWRFGLGGKRRARRRAGGALTFVLAAAVIGCAVAGESGDHLVVRSEAGDTTLVRNVRGSRWRQPARLEEEVRLHDSGPMSFGSVDGLWLTSDSILVVDGDAARVLRFDRDGSYLGDLGRDGGAEPAREGGQNDAAGPRQAGRSGPWVNGESAPDDRSQSTAEDPAPYEAPNGVVVTADGRVLVRDGIAPQRILVFSGAGELLGTWVIEERLGTATPMVLTRDGRLFARRLIDRSAPNDAERYAMVRIGPDGVVGEPLRFPGSDYRPLRLEVAPRLQIRVPYDPRAVLAMSPSATLIAGINFRYRLTLKHPDGRTTLIEKNWSDFDVPDGEREWERRRLVAWNRHLVPDWDWDGAEIPFRKPAYRDVLADRSGRLWVVRDGESVRIEPCAEDPAAVEPDEVVPCWRSRTLVEVFEEEGTYLGEVQLPDGVRLDATTFIEGDHILAPVDDPVGPTQVALFRLVRVGA